MPPERTVVTEAKSLPGVQGREAIVLLGVRGKILIAQAEQQGQVRLGSPAVLDKGIPGILPQIGLLVRGLERSLLRQTEQQVGKRRAGRSSAARGATGAGFLGEDAGEGVSTGDIAGIAKEVVMDATKVAAKTNVVLLVYP